MDVLTRRLCCSATLLTGRRGRVPTASAFSSRSGSVAPMRLLCPHCSAGGVGWRRISSVLPPPASALSADQQVDEDIGDSLNQEAAATKTVLVRFVLRKKCLFGQRFLIVGDDPIFGLWDPAKGVPLNWSDGHIWTAELDLPAEKSILFKFVLQGLQGQIIWQPGPNRVLQVRETTKAIVVSEEWDCAGKQKITKEETISIGSKISGNGSALFVDDNQTYENHAALGEMLTEKISKGTNDEEELLMGDDGEPVLIPDSTSVAASVLEADCNSSQDAEVMASKALVDEVAEDTSCGGAFTEQNLHPPESEPQPTVGVLKNDLFWGRSSLQQFLLYLGFNVNTTETT